MAVQAFGKAKPVEGSYTGENLQLEAEYWVNGFSPYDPENFKFDLADWTQEYGLSIADAVANQAYNDIKKQNAISKPIKKTRIGTLTPNMTINSLFDRRLTGFIQLRHYMHGVIDIHREDGENWRKLISLTRYAMARIVAANCVQDVVRNCLGNDDFLISSSSIVYNPKTVTGFDYEPKVTMADILNTSPKSEEIHQHSRSM